MVEVDIGGKTYRMATPYDEDYMRKISAMLDNKLTATMKGMRGRSIQQALILVALDVIDEYLQIKDKLDNERSILKGSLESAMKEVDGVVALLEQMQS